MDNELQTRKNSNISRNNGNNNSLFWRKVLVFVLIIIFVWLCFSSTKMLITYSKSKNNRIFAENQKTKVESDINELNKKIDQVKTGVGIEEHIRTKYPVVKDGERVLVITDESVKPIEKKTFWQKIKDFF